MMAVSRRSSRASSRAGAEKVAAAEAVDVGGNEGAAGGDAVEAGETQPTPVDTQATIVTQATVVTEATIPDSQRTEAEAVPSGDAEKDEDEIASEGIAEPNDAEPNDAEPNDDEAVVANATDIKVEPKEEPARADADMPSRTPLICPPRLEDKSVIALASDASFDLSGDVGAVGRVQIRDGRLSFDLKGVIYDAGRVASNSLCVVSVGDGEAKIMSISDEYLLLSESKDGAGGEQVTKGTIDFAVDDEQDENYEPGAAGKQDEKSRKRKIEADADGLAEEPAKKPAAAKKKAARKSSSKPGKGKKKAKK